MDRVIFHIDVNNAFLSWTAVRMLQNNHDVDIREIPSVIGGDESKRHGIVLAKSMPAKKMGVVTAESLYSARKKCPNLKVYPPEMEYYQKTSDELYKYLLNYSPDIERFSIDECFLDMSNFSYLYKDLVEVADKIKTEIKIKFGFSVNIGIGNNKLCAKMASDFEKPDKLHTLFKDEIQEKMWHLPVGELFMIGRKSTAKLNEMGIQTIGELANIDINVLKHHFKSFAIVMWEYANGLDNEEVMSNRNKNKCISVSWTLPTDVDDSAKLKNILLSQAEEVGISLRKQKMYTTLVAITIKTKEFVSYSKQMTISNPTNLTEEIYRYAIRLFELAWNGEEVRNIGIRIGEFRETREEQLSLFDKIPSDKDDKMQSTLDNIKEKYGLSSIMPAALISKYSEKK